jgi:hypothetical protein
MSLLLDVCLKGGFLFDALGVIGLGLVAMAAVRLSRRYRSWGGSLLAGGAVLLLVGRLWTVLSPQVFTPGLKAAMGETLGSLLSLTPMALLTLGLAGIVWGLWGHEQWLREER